MSSPTQRPTATPSACSGTTLNALHFLNEPLDVGTRFEPIGRFASSRILLAVNPKVIDVKTLPELRDYLKRHPNTPLTSAGHGGLGHLGLELFAMEQGLKIMHVAYRGNGPALNDVLAGQVGGLITEVNQALRQIESGKLRAINVKVRIKSRTPRVWTSPT